MYNILINIIFRYFLSLQINVSYNKIAKWKLLLVQMFQQRQKYKNSYLFYLFLLLEKKLHYIN